MLKKTRYIADDGKECYTESDCIAYEERCANITLANDAYRNGASLMLALGIANRIYPQWDSALSVEDRRLLMNTRETTVIAIPHWCCSTQKTFAVIRIENDGRLFVHGPSHISSGGYGNGMTVQEYCRLAHLSEEMK